MNAKILLSAMLAVALPAAAHCGVRPWLTGTVGPSSYLMTAVNHDIRVANAELDGSGMRWDEITTGVGLGGAVGLDLGNGLSLGLGYDRLAARSEIGSAAGSAEMDVPGNLFRAFARYTSTTPTRWRGFVEVSAGRVSTAGTLTASAPGFGSLAQDIKGSGPAYEGSVGAEYRASPWLALTASAGGRIAKSKDVSIGGVPASTSTGDPLTVDHGGAFVRAGLTVSPGR